MRRPALLVSLLAATTFLSLPALAAALTPEEIRATFATGAPFYATTPAGASYAIVLNSDGTASRTPKGSKVTTIAGTWHLSNDGYCSKWGKSPESCYTIEKGIGQYNILDSSGRTIAYWKMK